MPYLNQAIVMGHLGRDAETREVGSQSVATLAIATTEKWTSRDGEKRERTDWHRVEIWGKPVEWVRHWKRGDCVLAQGSLKTETWEKDGERRSAVKINVAYGGSIRMIREKNPQARQESQQQKPDDPDDEEFPF